MEISVLKKELLKKLNSENKELVNNIISYVLNVKTTELIMINSVTLKQAKKCYKIANLLNCGVPFQHIEGQVDFLNVTIKVNKNVLIPRSETELLTDLVINYINQNKVYNVLDLCCGSGAIGIAISKNTNSFVTLSDISNKALKIAKQNAKLNGVNVKFFKSNMFNKIYEKFDLIVSNPPYIPTNDINNLSVSVKDYEPKLALNGGKDGLQFYKIIANLAKNHLNPNGVIFLEIGIGQENDVVNLLKENFTDIKVIPDYNKINRIIFAKIKV